MCCACSSLHGHCPGDFIICCAFCGATPFTEPQGKACKAGDRPGKPWWTLVDPGRHNRRSGFAFYFASGGFHRAAGVYSTLNIFRSCLTDEKGFIVAAIGFLACSWYMSGRIWLQCVNL